MTKDCECERPRPVTSAPGAYCYDRGGRVRAPEQKRVKMEPDEFALSQWRTLVRMVKDMQKRYQGLKFE